MNHLSCRVLLVEDNEDDYLILRDLLGDAATTGFGAGFDLGFDLHWAQCFQGARARLQGERWDVALIDYRLGEATGVDLVREFGADGPPFILLTGNDDYAVDLEAARAGVADYLVKGRIDAALLERSIRYAIERKRTEAALLQAQRFAQATVDALGDNIVVLDEHGTIVAVNAAWRRSTAAGNSASDDCASDNGLGASGLVGAGIEIGANYLGVCDGSAAPEGRVAAAGIRGVILGEQQGFCFEYEAGLPAKGRWFEMCATRFEGPGPLHIVVAHEDISARKRQEAQLRMQGRLLGVIAQAVVVTDRAGIITYWNHFAEHLYGWRADEVLGRNVLEVTPTDATHARAAEIMECVTRGENWSGEFTAQKRDGTPFPVYVTNSPVFGESGDVVSIIGLSVDISERKQAEAALEATTRAIVVTWESMTDAFFSVDCDWRLTQINSQALKLWNKSGQNLLGQRLWDLFPGAEDAKFGTEFRRAREQGVTVSFEAMYAPHGAWREVHAYPSPLGLSVYFRDISERKEAEKQLHFQKTLLEAQTEASLDGILVVSGGDEQKKILSFNGRLVQMWGIPAHVAASGDDAALREAIMSQVAEREAVSRRAAQIYEHPSESTREEIALLDGRIFDRYSAPIADDAGVYFGRVWYFRDITAARIAENTLRASEERFGRIMSNVPGMVYQFAMHGDGGFEWPFVSQGCREIFEVEGEVVQNDPTLTMKMIHPEDRADFFRSVSESAQTLLPWRWEGRHRLPSGKIKWIQGAARPQRLGRNSTQWDGVVMDITARKEAEIERDRFFELSLDMLAVLDFEGHFKRLNPAFCEVLGYCEAELMATPFLEWIHPDDHAASIAAFESVSSTGYLSSCENRYRCKDGSYRWLEWKSAAAAEAGVIYAAARDVTGRKAAETALLRLRDELEERVEGRTAELERSNATLQAEVLERERAEREVRAQARQHEAVADLGRRALLDLDLDTLLESAVKLVAATLEVEICSFWQCLPGGETLRYRAGFFAADRSSGAGSPVAAGSSSSDWQRSVSNESHLGYAALLGEPVVSQDLENETRFQSSPFLIQQGIKSTIAVPVQDGALYGVVAACSTDNHKFGQNEIFFIQAITNVLSSAIARAQTQHEIQSLNLELQAANAELRANETRLLQGNQISTDLMRLRVHSQPELEQALREVTEAASLMLDVERASVWLFNEQGTRMRCADLYERAANRHRGGFEVLEDQDVFTLIQTQRIIAVDDVQSDLAPGAYWKSYLVPLGISSVLEVALVVGGRHIGVLCLSHVGPPRQWQAQDRTFASAVASVCSLVLESYERSRAETALQAAKEEAELAREEAEGAREQAELASLEANAANAAKSEFLSRMSHELRTPLNAILGFGQILEMRSSEPKQQGNIAQILKAGRHLLELINEVLDIARIEAGHMSLSLEPICVATMVGETLDLVRPLASARGIELHDEVAGAIGERHLLADQQRLKQVLLNLLSNAVKYNCEAGHVFVCARITEPGAMAGEESIVVAEAGTTAGATAGATVGAEAAGFGPRLRIEVRDTGPGLSSEDIFRVFVPFERLSAAHTQIEGTGIGLALCKRLVEAMNGAIGVESQAAQSIEAQGSTFWVEMPLSEDPLERVVRELRLETLPEISQTASTILCIEDNLSNINLIQQVLQEQRHHTRLLTAMQGSVGLELANQHRPDLILLDIHLPDIRGEVVLSRLKSNAATRDIPVVVLSADATPSQIERLLAGGAHAYLTKPLDLKQFFNVIEAVLNRDQN